MLFDDFPGMTKEEWKHLLLQSIKTDNQSDKLNIYAQKLIQNPEPDIEIQPFYTPEDMAGLEYLQGFHRLWVQTRQTTGWMNLETIKVYNEKVANQQAKDALTKGADSITFDLLNRPGGKPMLGGGFTTEHLFDFSVLLQDIFLSQLPVYFRLRHNQLKGLSDYLQAVEKDITAIMGGLTFEEILLWDILPDDNARQSFIDAFENSIFSKATTPYFRSFIIEPIGELFADEDGEMETFALPQTTLLTNQLRAAMQFVDYYAKEAPANEILPQIGFVVDIGDHYFMEIAKLRALRLLWWQIGRMYDESLNLIDVFIHAQTTIRLAPEKEPYKSLLTNTTQAMSAIIGGCDALTVNAGVFALEKDTILAQRIARNVSVILKEESYFDKVTDIGAGSYLIENLTHQLAKAVWEKLSENE